jgi:hypothetical protein
MGACTSPVKSIAAINSWPGNQSPRSIRPSEISRERSIPGEKSAASGRFLVRNHSSTTDAAPHDQLAAGNEVLAQMTFPATTKSRASTLPEGDSVEENPLPEGDFPHAGTLPAASYRSFPESIAGDQSWPGNSIAAIRSSLTGS